MQTLLNAHTHSHNRKNVPVPLILQRKINPIWFISEFIHIVHIASNVNCSLAWGNKFKRIHTYVHEWSGNRSLSPWEFHRSILSIWIENLYCSTHPVSRLTLSYFSQTEHHSYDNIEWCAAELSENDRMHKFIFYGNSHLKWVQNSNKSAFRSYGGIYKYDREYIHRWWKLERIKWCACWSDVVVGVSAAVTIDPMTIVNFLIWKYCLQCLLLVSSTIWSTYPHNGWVVNKASTNFPYSGHLLRKLACTVSELYTELS